MTNDGNIPQSVFRAMRKKAKLWADNDEHVERIVADEVAAYEKFHGFDFGNAAPFRNQILKHVKAIDEEASWEERLTFLADEISAFHSMGNLKHKGVPRNALAAMAEQAQARYPESFADQLDHVERSVAKYRNAQEIRREIGPIKGLLIDMEHLIGSKCYNSNIQNYGPGGSWEGEGRSFRYPLTVITTDEETRKRRLIDREISEEELITGFYKVGANEMSVVRALVKIVRMIEKEYGVDLRDQNRLPPSDD